MLWAACGQGFIHLIISFDIVMAYANFECDIILFTVHKEGVLKGFTNIFFDNKCFFTNITKIFEKLVFL